MDTHIDIIMFVLFIAPLTPCNKNGKIKINDITKLPLTSIPLDSVFVTNYTFS